MVSALFLLFSVKWFVEENITWRQHHYFLCCRNFASSVGFLEVSQHMKSSVGLIIGLSVGFVIGSLLAAGAVFFCLYFLYSQSNRKRRNARTQSGLPFRNNVVDSSSVLSDSTSAQGSPNALSDIIKRKKDLVSFSGVLKYSYKYNHHHHLYPFSIDLLIYIMPIFC